MYQSLYFLILYPTIFNFSQLYVLLTFYRWVISIPFCTEIFGILYHLWMSNTKNIPAFHLDLVKSVFREAPFARHYCENSLLSGTYKTQQSWVWHCGTYLEAHIEFNIFSSQAAHSTIWANVRDLKSFWLLTSVNWKCFLRQEQWWRVLAEPLSGSVPVTHMAPRVHSKVQSQAIISRQAKAETGELPWVRGQPSLW